MKIQRILREHGFERTRKAIQNHRVLLGVQANNHRIWWENASKKEKEAFRAAINVRYSKWTPKDRARHAATTTRGMVEWWEGMSTEEQSAFMGEKSKRVQKWQLSRSPQEQKKSQKKRRQGYREWWDSMSAKERREHSEMKRQEWERLSAEEKQKVREKVRKQSQKWWNEMTDEQRISMVRKIHDSQKPRRIRYKNGKTLLIHSAWEANAYPVVKRLYPDAVFQSEEGAPSFIFKNGEKKRVWHPDFFIPSENLIIEVKGHVYAWQVWEGLRKIFALKENKAFRKKYRVAILPMDIKKVRHTIKTKEDLDHYLMYEW
jgi:hypothetical protein